ncbi:MAG: class F sortase [Lapillicoccus sp.]
MTGRSGATRVVVLLATLALTGGCQAGPSSPPDSISSIPTGGVVTTAPSTEHPGPTAPQGGVDGPGGPVPAPAGRAAPVSEGLRPVRISLPTIRVDAPLVDLGLAADGHVQVPARPQDAGWLTTSPAPGQQGPAVILGHVDSTTGPAVFYPLRHLAVGDPVVVTRRDGSQVRFTVDGLQQFAKTDFPTQATYGPVPGPALRLITCDGPYDRSAGGYQDNLVVFAS